MAKVIIIKNEIKDAFFAVRILALSDKSVVIVKKIGIVPNGLMRVKNEVRLKSPKANNVFIN